jgi:hypothetical protein
MKTTYESFTATTFRIKFCVNGNTSEVTITPLVDDEWVTTTVDGEYYDVNLWLDDNVGRESEGVVRFGVYHVKPDPDNSPDGLWITDSKMACSSDCPESVIEVVNC